VSRIRMYRMTIASAWYDQRAEVQREFEMHFKTARAGKIRNVRRALARRGIPYFQQAIYRKHHRWIRKDRIRVSYEPEEPAVSSERNIVVTGRGMQYRGRNWKPSALPNRVITYAKKNRKRKSSRGKRA
jgi:hypothetical protein